jgi:hypothetical protein
MIILVFPVFIFTQQKTARVIYFVSLLGEGKSDAVASLTDNNTANSKIDGAKSAVASQMGY